MSDDPVIVWCERIAIAGLSLAWICFAIAITGAVLGWWIPGQ